MTRKEVINMADPNKRIANYIYGENPDKIKETLVAKKPEMVAAMTQRINELYQYEQLVKGVLASEGAVTVIQVPFYHDFAREIYAKQRIHPGGAQLNNDVALMLAKWKGRGLTEAVLIRIRNECFSIPAPAAP
jgi:hypothetical protein